MYFSFDIKEPDVDVWLAMSGTAVIISSRKCAFENRNRHFREDRWAVVDACKGGDENGSANTAAICRDSLT